VLQRCQCAIVGGRVSEARDRRLQNWMMTGTGSGRVGYPWVSKDEKSHPAWHSEGQATHWWDFEKENMAAMAAESWERFLGTQSLAYLNQPWGQAAVEARNTALSPELLSDLHKSSTWSPRMQKI